MSIFSLCLLQLHLLISNSRMHNSRKQHHGPRPVLSLVCALRMSRSCPLIASPFTRPVWALAQFVCTDVPGDMCFIYNLELYATVASSSAWFVPRLGVLWTSANKASSSRGATKFVA